MSRWQESKHPRDPATGRFVRKRTELPVGSGKGNRSYSVGKRGWPAHATVMVGPGGGKGATIGARVRYRSPRTDLAVGVVARSGAVMAPVRRRLERAAKMPKRRGEDKAVSVGIRRAKEVWKEQRRAEKQRRRNREAALKEKAELVRKHNEKRRQET